MGAPKRKKAGRTSLPLRSRGGSLGVVAVQVALMMTVLIGFAAVVFDVGETLEPASEDVAFGRDAPGGVDQMEGMRVPGTA